MANHVSSLKRARQSEQRRLRNNTTRSKIRNVSKDVRSAATKVDAEKALSVAFSAIQKSRGVLSKKTMGRRMSRLAKAAAKLK